MIFSKQKKPGPMKAPGKFEGTLHERYSGAGAPAQAF
jgi:hypothetical protein